MNRRDVATYLSNHLVDDRASAVRHVAAWLVSNKRTAEVRYLANDAAAAREQTGYTMATLTSAHPISTVEVESYLKQRGATQVEFSTEIDPSLIGGAIITTPTASLDLSIRHALTNLDQGDTL